MKIPEEFKNAIKKVMYDKVFQLYETKEVVNEELEVIREKGKKLYTFNGNIRPTSGDIALNEYGLNISADFMITTDEKDAISKDKIISYEGKDYHINGILNYDSHTKIFIEKVLD